MKFASVSLLVRDYDEALAYYTGVLGFTLSEDSDLGEGKRWVVVSPGPGGSSLLLARAVNEAEKAQVGNQAGGRVFLFLQTDDFWATYRGLQERGVEFLETPRVETYATVAVFADLYGNKWDLLQPSAR